MIIENQHKIAKLIVKAKLDILSESEKQVLDTWRLEGNNEQLFYKLYKQEFYKDTLYKNISTYAAYKKYNKRYKKKLFTLKRIVSVAASLIILINLYFVFNYTNSKDHTVAGILPGKPQAILVLNNGQKISLDGNKIESIKEKNNTEIYTADNGIVYNNKKTTQHKQRQLYNTIVTPIGGEYKVELVDGTTIWVNSKTKIKYPVNLVDSIRRIYLEGEAFFKVAKNKKKPFVVSTLNKSKIKVLGTEFNVKAYNDEPNIETVLVEGSVSFTSQTDKVILKPGFMGSIEPKQSKIKVNKVDTYVYTAWKNKRFAFEYKKISDILKTLSRWYNIEVKYLDKSIANKRYTLDVRKYTNINTILSAIEATGNIKFKMKGRTLYVNKNTDKD